MGSRETLPPLPDLEANQLPDGEWSATMIQRECNWLQALEGDIDTSHLGFLHLGALEPEDLPTGSFDYYTVKDRAPRYVALDTPYGAMYGAYRASEPGYLYWRVAQFLFPFYTHIPTGLLGREIRTRCWVPMDDTHTMYFMISKRPTPTDEKAPSAPVRSAFLENTTDWFGRYRMAQNWENDFLMDREEQRELGSYTGIPGAAVPEDTAVQVSMGATLDRTIEHLGTTDLMIIRTRQRLLEAARAFADHKTPPPGVDEPQLYATRAGGVFIPEGAVWTEFVKDLVPAFVDHPEIDAAIEGGGRTKVRHKRAPAPD